MVCRHVHGAQLNGRLSRGGLLLVLLSWLPAAGGCGERPVPSFSDAGPEAGRREPAFRCITEQDEACLSNVHYSCERRGEFLTAVTEDCSEMDRVCVRGLGCAVCEPARRGCIDRATVGVCRADGSGLDPVETCDVEAGQVCEDGACVPLCDLSASSFSYQGCEFYAVDLDNAALGPDRDASSQQFAVVVSNPGSVPAHVVVEVNDAAPGDPPQLREVASVTVPPGDLEVFELPRREVDGSSSNQSCLPDDRHCPQGEVCVCSARDTEPPCFCRNAPDASGLNDGTHTALTSHAYRLRSTVPIIAYQFNPLDNVGVFSNDASMLAPVTALGERYTVVGWPQTIADGPDDMPGEDFDPRRDDEDLRAFLAIVGTEPGTHVRVTLGQQVRRVVAGGPVPESTAGDVVEADLGRFDVLNLETALLNSDFTGSRIEASAPVAVFVGSEASDAPRFVSYEYRQCCADHLEEQLFPERALGTRYVVARMPARTRALNEAFVTDTSVAEVDEPEYVRVVAVSGPTTVHTTLPAPMDVFTLDGDAGEDMLIEAHQDFLLWTDDNRPVAVLQVQPSQEVVGIPNQYPGGDPAMLAVPPRAQWRRDYVFLTPDKYAFDFVTIAAPAEARIRLDGMPLSAWGCERGPADGIERGPDDPPPDLVVYRCTLSLPDVYGEPPVHVEPGMQRDGVHRLVADLPVGVLVYGFDAYVSYAYVAGLDLKPLPR